MSLSGEQPQTRGLGTAALIRKSVRRLAIATVVLWFAVIAVGIYIYVNSNKTNTALCSLRGDVVSRVQASIDYLADHPQGIKGIATADELISQIGGQQRTILALSNLDCGTKLKIPQVPVQPAP